MSADPDATGHIEVHACAQRVYELVSDPGVLAQLAGEYTGHSWLGGATGAVPGARFRGRNRNGVRRWSTVVTITEAEPGSVLAFDVVAGPIPVSRWRYDIEATESGCRVTESAWDRRPGWFRLVTVLATGVRDRAARNQRNIDHTLAALKKRAES